MVIINKISKNIWPLYIPPEKEELFSSWFCRLSNNHLIRSESFLTNYFGRSAPFWNRDIDMSIPKNYINEIFNHTPIKIEQIENLFLTSYELFAFEKANPNGITTNVLSLGIKHRKRKFNSLLFCPICLSKSIPYFKKSWRLSTSLICTECNSYLIDHCSNCKKPISFHRNNINKINNSTSECNPLNICECGYNLSLSKIDVKPTNLEIKYQNFVDNTIANGYNHHTQYSFLYIKGLLMIAYSIGRDNPKNKLNSIISEIYECKIPRISNYYWLWSLEERRKILPLSYLLLENYPIQIGEVLRIGEINRSDFFGLPYFIESKIINK